MTIITTIQKETILIVDDEEPVRRPLRKLLAKNGYSCLEADSASAALQRLSDTPIDLTILDIMMPQKSGIELLPEIKEQYPDTAIVMATAVVEPDIIIECMKNGAMDYIRKPFKLDTVVGNLETVLRKRQLSQTLKIFQESLKGKVAEQAAEMRQLFFGAIESLICALEAKDKYTAGHSRRVGDFTIAIARLMDIPVVELEDIRCGALLHDVGKIAINPDIQNKPGKLTEEEYKYIMTHVQIGANIVKSIANEKIVDIIRYHHTRFDGACKDQTLCGTHIPLCARIVTLADAFDAMTSERSYRKSLALEEAISEVKRCAGTQFDPAIVEVFLKIPSNDILTIMKTS
ncbi:MAG: response regulator [Dehalococcoidales bacterium]|nr:response regulator [Dehalococcoidales bacterium]